MIDILDLGHELRMHIWQTAANNPRSLQRAIGPSEVGTPCVRRIGYKLVGTPATNQADTWLATIGTAVHAWLAETFNTDRFLVEHRVQVTEGLAGSIDLFDKQTKTVIDWKVVGDTSLKRYKANGPGEQYRTQAHLYGVGLTNAGYEVEQVAIAFLPRGGSLRAMHLWSEPFNPQIAWEAINRLQLARASIESAGADALGLLPATESHCHFCPFFLPGSTEVRTGCPGADPSPTRPNKGEAA